MLSMTKSKKLAKAQARWSQKIQNWLAWHGSLTNSKFEPNFDRAQKQVGCPRYARLGLGRKSYFQPRLGSGSDINHVLSWTGVWF